MAPKKTTPKAKKTATAPKAAGALFVRDEDLVADIDAWVEELNNAAPDAPQWNRTTLTRAVMKRAMRERRSKGEAP